MQNEATLKKHITKLRVVMRDLVDDILGSDPGSLSLQDSVGDLQHTSLGNPHHRVGHKPQNSIILEGKKGIALRPGILRKMAPQKCRSQGRAVAREHLTEKSSSQHSYTVGHIQTLCVAGYTCLYIHRCLHTLPLLVMYLQ